MRRRQLDLFSLISGLAFAVIAVLYLLDSAGQLSVNGRLVIPLLLIALGVAGLAGALHRMARRQQAVREQAQWERELWERDPHRPEAEHLGVPVTVGGPAVGSPAVGSTAAGGTAPGPEYAPAATPSRPYRYEDEPPSLDAPGPVDEGTAEDESPAGPAAPADPREGD